MSCSVVERSGGFQHVTWQTGDGTSLNPRTRRSLCATDILIRVTAMEIGWTGEESLHSRTGHARFGFRFSFLLMGILVDELGWVGAVTGPLRGGFVRYTSAINGSIVSQSRQKLLYVSFPSSFLLFG